MVFEDKAASSEVRSCAGPSISASRLLPVTLKLIRYSFYVEAILVGDFYLVPV